MSNNFPLTLDTTSPSSPSVSFNEGAFLTASDRLANLSLSASGGDVTQMKIWGDVDLTHNANIKTSEGTSEWIAFSASQQIKVSSGDGAKNVYVKFRDDVLNESSQASANITLDTSLPLVTIQSGPDVTKISKNATKDICSFQFDVDCIFDEYEVAVVASIDSARGTGTVILTTNGSTNMSGNAGDYPATTNIACTIKGADLQVASASDGAKIVKVFVKDKSGNWSA